MKLMDPVCLPANPNCVVGVVWQESDEMESGLWRSALLPDPSLVVRRIDTGAYIGGPFGTRSDAEMDVIEAYQRAVYMR
jgi:hypothetical protein